MLGGLVLYQHREAPKGVFPVGSFAHLPLKKTAQFVGLCGGCEGHELLKDPGDECGLAGVGLNKISGYLLQQFEEAHADTVEPQVGVVHQHHPDRIQRVHEVASVRVDSHHKKL